MRLALVTWGSCEPCTFFWIVLPGLPLPHFLLGLVDYCGGGDVFSPGSGLRYLAITTLGRRWCVKAMAVPGESVVRKGIYTRVRHPNYLGVCLEIFGLPLAAGFFKVALFFGLANLALLRVRIAAEEKALMEESGLP